MMNTMDDLKEKVHQRAYENVHTERVSKKIPPNEIIGEEERFGGLLNFEHSFWRDYDKDISSECDAEDEVIFAILKLREEDKIRLWETESGDSVFVRVEAP